MPFAIAELTQRLADRSLSLILIATG
jgi:hypothetical protein